MADKDLGYEHEKTPRIRKILKKVSLWFVIPSIMLFFMAIWFGFAHPEWEGRLIWGLGILVAVIFVILEFMYRDREHIPPIYKQLWAWIGFSGVLVISYVVFNHFVTQQNYTSVAVGEITVPIQDASPMEGGVPQGTIVAGSIPSGGAGQLQISFPKETPEGTILEDRDYVVTRKGRNIVVSPESPANAYKNWCGVQPLDENIYEFWINGVHDDRHYRTINMQNPRLSSDPKEAEKENYSLVVTDPQGKVIELARFIQIRCMSSDSGTVKIYQKALPVDRRRSFSARDLSILDGAGMFPLPKEPGKESRKDVRGHTTASEATPPVKVHF